MNHEPIWFRCLSSAEHCPQSKEKKNRQHCPIFRGNFDIGYFDIGSSFTDIGSSFSEEGTEANPAAVSPLKAESTQQSEAVVPCQQVTCEVLTR